MTIASAEKEITELVNEHAVYANCGAKMESEDKND